MYSTVKGKFQNKKITDGEEFGANLLKDAKGS